MIEAPVAPEGGPASRRDMRRTLGRIVARHGHHIMIERHEAHQHAMMLALVPLAPLTA
jgi:hypothetical protein